MGSGRPARGQACSVVILLLGLLGMTRPVGAMGADRLPADSSEGLAASGRTEPVTVTLVAEHSSIQPGGATRVGVLFEMDEGWHIYAQDPGDAGLPTKIVWSGLEDAIFGPMQWPAPERFLDPGDIHTFGYHGSVTLARSMQLAPSKIRGASVSIHAKVTWLACKEVCLPGSVNLELHLPVSDTPPAFSDHAALFQ